MNHRKSKRVAEKYELLFIDYAKAFDCMDQNKMWKILKDTRIPNHCTCLLRNLYAGQKATVRTGHGTTDWFQSGKGLRQDYILSLCLFNVCEYNCRVQKPGWMKHKLESRLPREIITSDAQMTPPLWQKAKRN